MSHIRKVSKKFLMDELMNENVIYNIYRMYLFTECMCVYVCMYTSVWVFIPWYSYRCQKVFFLLLNRSKGLNSCHQAWYKCPYSLSYLVAYNRKFCKHKFFFKDNKLSNISNKFRNSHMYSANNAWALDSTLQVRSQRISIVGTMWLVFT